MSENNNQQQEQQEGAGVGIIRLLSIQGDSTLIDRLPISIDFN